MDAKLRPMLCEPAPLNADGEIIVPEGSEWTAEGKLDGWRIVAHKTNGGLVHAYSRGGDDYGQRIPSIVGALAGLPDDTVVDGELIGAEFGTVQSQVTSLNGSDLALSYVIFDVLRIGGTDTRAMPWSDRRLLLERMKLDAPLMLSPTGESSPATLEQMLKLGLEGIVCKRRDARYVNGRSALWIKCKPQATTEAQIIGFEAGKKGGRWEHGVGAFTVRLLETGAETTVKCGTDANHNDAHAHPERWLNEVIEIRHHGFQAKTGKVRHPVFHRRRDDLTPPPAHAPRASTRRAKPSAATNGATGKMRNYGAMKDAKLLACLEDLERGSGDAYERALTGSGQPAADLARARELASQRGLR
jgi:ATP-dependent DNA ligase